MHMKPYILLTPGPLTTSQTVKEAMLTDWCTWDEDYNLHIVEEIRKSLVSLATQHTGDYTSILLQGSGTYCVEAVIGALFSTIFILGVSAVIAFKTFVLETFNKSSRCNVVAVPVKVFLSCAKKPFTTTSLKATLSSFK